MGGVPGNTDEHVYTDINRDEIDFFTIVSVHDSQYSFTNLGRENCIINTYTRSLVGTGRNKKLFYSAILIHFILQYYYIKRKIRNAHFYSREGAHLPGLA